MQLALDDLVYVSLWGHVEATVCVILACIPRIGIFFMRLYRKYTWRDQQNLHSNDASVEQRGGDDFVPSGRSPRPFGSASNSGMSEVGKTGLSGEPKVVGPPGGDRDTPSNV